MVPLQLRGHHFLCVLTYKGHGYTEKFCENLTDIADQIKAGREVVLVSGPDDICAGLSTDCRSQVKHDCKAMTTRLIDRAAVHAVQKHLQRDLTIANPISLEEIASLRTVFLEAHMRTACTICSWKSLCDDIAASDFEHCVL